MFAGAISVNSVVLCLLIQLLNHPTTMGHNFVLLAAQGRVGGLRGAGRWLQVLPSFRAVIYFLQIDANSLNGVCGGEAGVPWGNRLQWVYMGTGSVWHVEWS